MKFIVERHGTINTSFASSDGNKLLPYLWRTPFDTKEEAEAYADQINSDSANRLEAVVVEESNES